MQARQSDGVMSCELQEPTRDVCSIPLSEPIPGLELVEREDAAGADGDPFATELTTLENGLRVASTDMLGSEYCTIGSNIFFARSSGNQYNPNICPVVGRNVILLSVNLLDCGMKMVWSFSVICGWVSGD